MNQQTLHGNWNEIKGKITEKWADLTGDELQKVKSNSDQLIGLIQRKTGESREAISEFLDKAIQGDGVLGNAVDTARGYAAAAAETAQETAQQAADQVRAGYIQTERMVRRHPLESLGISFGVGLVTGVITGLLMRSR